MFIYNIIASNKYALILILGMHKNYRLFPIQFIFIIIYEIFLVLFINFIILFQLIFTFIYNIFSNKFLISTK